MCDLWGEKVHVRTPLILYVILPFRSDWNQQHATFESQHAEKGDLPVPGANPGSPCSQSSHEPRYSEEGAAASSSLFSFMCEHLCVHMLTHTSPSALIVRMIWGKGMAEKTKEGVKVVYQTIEEGMVELS